MPIGPTGSRYRRIPGNWQAAGSVTTASLTNQGVTYTAETRGAEGNGVSITIEGGGPLNRALAVSVTGDDITVTPATDGAGAITTTTAGVRDAVNGNAAASDLVTASGGDATVVAALATTNLAGGADYVIGRGR